MNKVHCVLLVDDDTTTNFLNEIIISDLKVADHVHSTYNGAEALEFIKEKCVRDDVKKENCPELIFLDINMPFMDGFEFLEKYNEFNEEIKNNISIYLLTSSQDKKDVKKSKEYQISGYINKPLTEEKLLNVIKNKIANEDKQ